MDYVRGAAVGWIDGEWPGWVEVRLRESDGTVVTLVDKAPVFDCGNSLLPGVEFPVELELPCDVLDRTAGRDGKRSVMVRLRSGLEDQCGCGTFRVDEGDVISRL